MLKLHVIVVVVPSSGHGRVHPGNALSSSVFALSVAIIECSRRPAFRVAKSPGYLIVSRYQRS